MEMRAAFTIIMGIATTVSALAQGSHRLRELVVTSARPMKDIGVQVTAIDSAALKENISLSMADVLTFNSSIFVKSHGRATLSTVAFRGTSPSHTQVTWNGMRINNPMLGMTDFSTIPSYFIDNARLLHGSSSVNETGGGLGGLVKLSTAPVQQEGLSAQFVQGVGSFSTFDEFLRLSYANDRWSTSTRVVYSSSPNKYPYTNHDKRLNIYDEDHNIISQYHPREKNRSGAYRDMHILQEVYYDNLKGDRFGINAWYIHSDRELPMLTTDYGRETSFENRQREHTLRSLVSWKHSASGTSFDARAGYIHTWMAYDYKRDVGGAGGMASMTRSRNHVNTLFSQAEASYFSDETHLMLTAGLSAHQHFVKSHDKDIITTEGSDAIVGYDKGRIEMSASLSARWSPSSRLGMALVLRDDMYGNTFAPLTPAFFIDGVISCKGNLKAKASVTRNYRFPTLNDLYFLPGGNPDLKNEHGFTYDCGLSFDAGRSAVYALSGSVTWFDSYINNWIIWLPTTKGFFSPRNLMKVHAYGVETQASLNVKPGRDWLLQLNSSLSWTPSVNKGRPLSPADKSVGKQLPYVPRCAASVNGRLCWRNWNFLYKWAYYSHRFTQSSNENTITGRLPRYFMSNVALGCTVPTKAALLDLKLAVNNIFDEDYLSVLAHPMPGVNFELFIGITPEW